MYSIPFVFLEHSCIPCLYVIAWQPVLWVPVDHVCFAGLMPQGDKALIFLSTTGHILSLSPVFSYSLANLAEISEVGKV